MVAHLGVFQDSCSALCWVNPIFRLLLIYLTLQSWIGKPLIMPHFQHLLAAVTKITSLAGASPVANQRERGSGSHGAPEEQVTAWRLFRPPAAPAESFSSVMLSCKKRFMLCRVNQSKIPAGEKAWDRGEALRLEHEPRRAGKHTDNWGVWESGRWKNIQMSD